LKKSQEVHGINKYDYSKGLYKRNSIKIEIICKEHGLNKPLNHINGHGCPKCVGRNKTTDEFIIEANKIHFKSL
jgi:hypothetical protein